MFFICLFLKGLSQTNSPIELDNSYDINDFNGLSGINLAMIYSSISGDFQNGKYQNCQISAPIIAKIKAWNIRNFRFPGGSISNYYHFNGLYGYGSDSLEFECKPNYYFNKEIKNNLSNDKSFNCNFIYPFADAMVKLKEEGQSIEVNYVVNLFSHINHKHFYTYNTTIDSLFNKYDSIFENLKTKKLKLMDSTEIRILSDILGKMVLDNQFIEIKNNLEVDSSFKYYLKENLDALKYLISRNINLKRIELGNELFAKNLLLDDDLSEIGVDCRDTILETFDKGNFLGKNLIESLFKYQLLAEIYISNINTIGNFEYGIVSAPSNASIISENSNLKIKDIFGNNSKLKYFWNISVNRIPTKAVITHSYAQTNFNCEDINQNNIELLFNYAKELYNFYVDSLYFYDHKKLKSEFPNKEIWETEWNIGKPFMVANTLLHLGFVTDQLGNITKANALKDFNLKNAVYHLLSSQSIYNYALLRTGYYGGAEYKDTLQLLHFAFDIWKEILNGQYKYLNLNKENLFKSNSNLTKDLRTYSFFNQNENKFTFVYTNYGNNGIKFVPSDIEFKLYSANQLLVKKEIKYLNGQNLYSTDRNCDDQKILYNINDVQYFINDFQLINNDSINLPGYSVGIVNVYLSNATGIDYHYKLNAKVFPNPSNDIFFVELDKPQYNLNIKLVDVLGKVVFQQPFGDYRKTSISTQGLNGLYFLTIIDENGNTRHAQKIEIF